MDLSNCKVKEIWDEFSKMGLEMRIPIHVITRTRRIVARHSLEELMTHQYDLLRTFAKACYDMGVRDEDA